MTLHPRTLPALPFLLLAGCFGPATQELQSDPTAPPSLETARTIYADRTILTQGLHGTQIEFHRNDGKSFLWYPGNTSAVLANWKVQSYLGSSHEICWQYPSNSRNGITGLSSYGRFQCTPAFSHSNDISEILKGDPFGLATGKVPFRLERGKFKAAELAGRAQNVAPSSLKYAYQ